MGDLGSILGSERSPGEGKGYPLQYSGLENSMDRGVWQATVHGVAESDPSELGYFWSLPRGVSPRLEEGMHVCFPPELEQCSLSQVQPLL